METYRTFNPKEFNTLVLSNFKNESVYVNYDKCAKNLVMTTIKHSGYNVEDVYNHLHCILTETYPDYQDAFNNKQWSSVYQSNIKKGGELAAKLQAVLETMGKRKDNDELREKFFSCMDKMGINTKILKMDMAIDLFGWIETLELICKLAGYETDEKFYDDIKDSEEMETIKKEKMETIKGKSDKWGAKASKPVNQFSKDGKLEMSFTSVNEAIEWLNSTRNKKHHPKSIHQSCNKGGIAYGYLWEYKSEISEIKVPEEIKFQDEEETNIVAKTTKPFKRLEKGKLARSGKKGSELLVAYYMNKDKEIDRTREIGRFISQQDACNSLGINKGVLSNYLKGRKDSIFWNNEGGQKVRIGFERIAA